MPVRLVHDEGSMGIVGDVAEYLDQMRVHGADIAPRHDQGCRLAGTRTDRAEDVGGRLALVVWGRGPGTAPRQEAE